MIFSILWGLHFFLFINYLESNPYTSVWSLTHTEKDQKTQLIFFHFWVTLILLEIFSEPIYINNCFV